MSLLVIDLSNPGSFEDVVDLLVPELQKRGIYWDDYPVPGGTARENMQVKVVGDKQRPTDNILVPGGPRLPMDHPSAKFKFNYEELLEDQKSKTAVTERLPGAAATTDEVTSPEKLSGLKGTAEQVVSTLELRL